MNPELWQQAERLFLRCADLAPAEQTALLDKECAGQPGLRDAVMGLLRGDSAQESISGAIGKAARELSGDQEDRWKGARVGAYTLEERIAEGGMGVVYRARRSDSQYEQDVAVKLLAASLKTADMQARFRAERQILANLNHPHIAKLIDGGETNDGVPYLVMEFIDGTPIDVFCDSRQLTIDDRINLFQKVCMAVHHAHQHLVIHRDIKPSNILVTADGLPKLLDFGIAKLLESGQQEARSDLTQMGARLMTPRHASPEQIRGERVTTASDVYSLGLLLYELLCGDYPYRIDRTTDPKIIEETITGSQPRPPSQQLASSADAEQLAAARQSSRAQMQKALAGDLDTIVLCALRKEPGARYSTPREFADDLQRHLDRRPILARRPTPAYLLSRYWMRHRTAAAGLLATVIAILLGATAATVGFVKALESERVALAEARNSAAISDFLVSLFQEANPNNSAGRERTVHDILELGLARVDTDLEDSPAIKASVLETLSSVYKAQADYPNAEALLRRALAAHEAGAPQDLRGRARLLNDIGDLLRIQSRHTEAARFIEEAIDIHKRSGSTVSDDHADAVNNLSLIYQESGRSSDARAAMEEALRLRRELFQEPHPKIALSLHNLAWHHEKGGSLVDAERYAKLAIDMRVQVFGDTHPRVASTVSLLARIYRAEGRWEDAEAAARRAVAISEQIFDSGHPDLTFPLYQLAAVLHEKGELRDARDLFAKIVDWERISLGPDSHDLGMSLKAHAGTLLDLAEYELAEQRLREALAIFERLPAGSAYGREHAETQLGLLLARTGRTTESGRFLDLAGDVSPRELPGDEQPFNRRLAIAELALQRGDADLAIRIATALLAELDSKGGTAGVEHADARHLLGRALLAEGLASDAVDVLNRALQIYRQRWGVDHWLALQTQVTLARAQQQLGNFGAAADAVGAALPQLELVLGPEHPLCIDARQVVAGLAVPPG
jgi:eukaryotic-like serine/threonine-protein kinase